MGEPVNPALVWGGIIAVVVVIVLLQKLMRAGTKAATRAVARGTHARGQHVTRTPQRFTVPAPVAEVLEQIVQAVNAHPDPPALVGGLYLKGRAHDGLRFAWGSRVTDSFVLQVVVTSPDAQTTQGSVQVLSWTESTGLVDGIDHIQKLRGRIEAAVTQLGGTMHQAPIAPAI